DRLLDGFQQLDLLVIAERRRFAGGARDDDAVRSVGDEHDGQLLRRLVVHRPVGFERSDHGGEKTSDLRCCHQMTPIASACSAILTALSAAPLLRMSETSQSSDPRFDDMCAAMRTTTTWYMPA